MAHTKANVVFRVGRAVEVPSRDSTDVVGVLPTAAVDKAGAIFWMPATACPLPHIACHIIHPIAVRRIMVNWTRIGNAAQAKGIIPVIIGFGVIYG